MPQSPLHTAHLEAAATFAEMDGWQKPADFGGCMDEYHAVREGIGLLDRSERGKLVITGADRVSWLQGMVCNDVRVLEEGSPFVCACVLDATGHIQTDLRVINRGDNLLLDMPRATVEAVYQRFDGFVVMEDVEIVEQSDFLACISAQGPRATEAWVRQSTGEGAFIVPADHTGSGGFDLYVKADEALDLWKRLMEAGGKPVGEDALDILRIEAGFPAYGKELDETIIPLEANLEETHISHTKGCYVGQEIIARIHSRGHTNRALTGLLVDGSQLPRKGDKIVPVSDDTGKPAGWVTSACQSPALRRVIALAFVRHEHRAPGTALRILRGDGAITAEAAELPFVRPDAA